MISTISPKYPTISTTLEPIYLVIDHMPFGKFEDVDTISTLFQKFNLDASKTFFLFDHYLFFEPYKNNSLFTGFFFPHSECVQYNEVMPNFKLSFDNKKTFCCIMNKPRPQRIITSMWLANNFDVNHFYYTKSWNSIELSKESWIQNYNLSFKNTDLPFKWFDFMGNPPTHYRHNTNNAEIFYKILYPHCFLHSAVSIVLEPITGEQGCMITEKYMNAVYGATIPLIDGYMIGEVLEKIGFDIFGDIINYQYQYEKDPIKRVIKLLDDNINLLKNAIDVISDVSIQNRLSNNFNLIRNPDALSFNILHNLNSIENINRFKELSVDVKHPIISYINQLIQLK